MASKPTLESSDANKILFARFRLNIDPIKDYRVKVLDFPAHKAIDDFLNQIRQLRGGSREDILLEEYPPYRRLNAALLYLAPTLIHGFEKKVDWNRDRHSIALAEPTSLMLRHSNNNFSTKRSYSEETNRETIALVEPEVNDSIWYPEREQITDVVAVWAKQWAKDAFAKQLEQEDGRELIQELIDKIISKPESDWREHTIEEVWNSAQGVDGSLLWKSIPSLLAMLFVSKSSSLILGEETGARQKLTWNLVHNPNSGLAVISNPVTARSAKPDEGLIAYKLEFRVQTQAGDTKTPWIALYISLRRYAKSLVINKNDGNISVYVKMGTRIRKARWGMSQTLVALKAQGSIRKRTGKVPDYQLEWQDKLPELLSELRGREPLTPNELFANPSAVQPASDTDTYLITHAEGMKYKGTNRSEGHPIKSGTSLAERIDLFNHVIETLGEVLKHDQPIEVDGISTLSIRQIVNQDIYGLMTSKDLYEASKRDTKKAKSQLSTYREIIPESLKRNLGEAPIHIYVLHTDSEAPLAFRHYLLKLMLGEEGQSLPPSISIHHLHFSDDQGYLNEPFNLAFDKHKYYQSDYAYKKDFQKKHKNNIRDIHEQRLERIKSFFTKNINHEGVIFALIELPKKFNHEMPNYQWLKYTLRRACVERGILSQMILPINEKVIDPSMAFNFKGDIGRLRNGLGDLLLRQTGTLLASPASLYRYAGLPSTVAENLCVIGLYRHRTKSPYDIDFPVAVRLFANGYVDFILPHQDTGEPLSPISYVQGTKMGEYLAQNIPNFRPYKSDDWKRKTRLSRFAADIISSANQSHPTLILLEADGWRQEAVLPIADGRIRYNSLDVSRIANHQNYSPNNLRNIRILRVRDAGTLGETPQYVQVSGGIWANHLLTDDIEHMTLARDKSTSSNIPHAFSIGRRLVSMSKQKNDNYSFSDGADTAHKHQRAIELALFFHQPEDDIDIWLRIPHLLRVSPAWSGGNVMLPYPIHLARALVDDMLDALQPDIDFKNL